MKATDITLVASATSKRNELPIIKHVKVSTSGITASDLNVRVKRKEVIDTKEDFFVLPAELKARGIEGTLLAKDSIKGDFDAEDYPEAQQLKDPKTMVLTDDMVKYMAKAAEMASTDETRPVLTAVYLKSDNGKLEMTATDSYTLYSMQVAYDGPDVDILVPRRLLILVAKTKGKDFKMSWDNDMVEVYNADWCFTARQIEGKYPDWHKLVPKQSQTKITVSVDQLKQIKKLKPEGGALKFKLDSIVYTNSMNKEETVPKATTTERGNEKVELGAVKIVMPLKQDRANDYLAWINVEYLLKLAEKKTLNLYIPCDDEGNDDKLGPIIVEG